MQSENSDTTSSEHFDKSLKTTTDVSADNTLCESVDTAAFCAATSMESALQTLQMMMDDDSDVTDLGRLHFSICYDFNKRSLNVNVDEAKNLPAKDLNGTSDPYVKVG